MSHRTAVAVLLSAVALPFTAACFPPPASLPPVDYAEESMWLCRPGIERDRCEGDLTATEMMPDGSRRVVPHPRASRPAVDCFYVYPTVALFGLPGNQTDLSDTEPMAAVTLNQGARFSEVCRVYAPLYRQVTLASYASPFRDDLLDLAYDDVERAFDSYLEKDNHGRPIVLIGHSQGAHMIEMLLARRFDHDAALRKQLVVALPIGAELRVGEGSTTGGSFQNIPTCTDLDRPGCVVAFRTFVDGEGPAAGSAVPEGQEPMCVEPAQPGSVAPARVSRTYLPTRARVAINGIRIPEGIETPFVLYRDLYEARCVREDDGSAGLTVRYAPGPGDQRENPLDFDRFDGPLGLHVMDVNVMLGDLVDLARAKAAAFR